MGTVHCFAVCRSPCMQGSRRSRGLELTWIWRRQTTWTTRGRARWFAPLSRCSVADTALWSRLRRDGSCLGQSEATGRVHVLYNPRTERQNQIHGPGRRSWEAGGQTSPPDSRASWTQPRPVESRPSCAVRAQQAWTHLWSSSILAVSAAQVFVLLLLEGSTACALKKPTPTTSEVTGEFRHMGLLVLVSLRGLFDFRASLTHGQLPNRTVITFTVRVRTWDSGFFLGNWGTVGCFSSVQLAFQ